jgi:AcrR family transcriptional regulator
MPRIGAPTIEEHVRNQNGKVLDAASRLFRQRGLHGTDMSDIAQAVGLARNSLYRYYPNKEHLLVACVERDMGPFLEQFRGLETKFTEPRARVDAWIDMSIDIATSASHATLELMSEIKEASSDLRQQVMRLHQLPNEVLSRAVTALVAKQRRDPALVTAMIAGMVQSAAAQAIRRGSSAAVKRELKSACGRLLQS